MWNIHLHVTKKCGKRSFLWKAIRPCAITVRRLSRGAVEAANLTRSLADS